MGKKAVMFWKSIETEKSLKTRIFDRNALEREFTPATCKSAEYRLI
jgi:hypothetical protein